MMILPWVMDYNTGKLTCKITDNLEYDAISGGYEGYHRFFREDLNKEYIKTFIDPLKWEDEKIWLSEHYSDIVGTYIKKFPPFEFESNPRGGESDFMFGKDPEGGRLDHMQRPQALMEAEDCSLIVVVDCTKYETPDRGLTIFKGLPIEGHQTNYANKDEGIVWTEVPQPCHMQPWIQGRKLSSHEELERVLNSKPELAMMAEDIMSKCRQGLWDPPKRPDLQKFYIYPRQ